MISLEVLMKGPLSLVFAAFTVLLCLAAPASAQWCWDVCPPEANPQFGYPMCNTSCNNGGGDYTTCGGAGYECCVSGEVNDQVLGEWATPVVQGAICDLRVVGQKRWATICPDQTHYSAPWCEEEDDGWFFTMGQSCCEAHACWGQQHC